MTNGEPGPAAVPEVEDGDAGQVLRLVVDTRSPRGTVTIRLRRIYDAATVHDGTRVLVDRLWPRGIAKTLAELDEWCKEVAPSTDLRRWYGHDRRRFAEFRRRYRAELEGGEQGRAVDHLAALAQRERLTLLTATRELDISAAVVLAEHLGERLRAL